jgi:uncharacterized protein with ParB-like and HNH nuclease domain
VFYLPFTINIETFRRDVMPINQKAYFEAEEQEDEDEGLSFQEYDITSSPNDFNVNTIADFIDRGIFKIPGFQRNYVWDIGRASKLIESLILGLPIPQIFLYEQSRNNYLVIDGQQRLMSIYYFLKMRFPVTNKQNELRTIFDREGRIPPNIFSDDTYFAKFNLKLPGKLPKERSKLYGLNYDTLDELQTTLDLRTIRCVFVKQNFPQNDDSSVFEIFNRLNTGGMNLTPQEIRISLYLSDFMKMVSRSNADPRWRVLIDKQEPDLRMRDVEVLLRGFAMLTQGNKYAPSMTRFLNQFSKDMQDASSGELELLERILSNFLDMCHDFPNGIFGTRTKKLNISVFESVFSAACRHGYTNKTGEVRPISSYQIDELKRNANFMDAASTKSTNKDKVTARLKLARDILLGDL